MLVAWLIGVQENQTSTYLVIIYFTLCDDSISHYFLEDKDQYQMQVQPQVQKRLVQETLLLVTK